MKNSFHFALFVALLSVSTSSVFSADPPRKMPPPGIPIPPEDRKELTESQGAFAAEIAKAKTELSGKPKLLELMPDVEVFEKAVRYALEHNEFFKTNEIAIARNLLKQGRERLASLRSGNASWLEGTNLVVRTYVSKIDDSIQPYGLVLPEDFQIGETKKRRLDLWLHGRDDKLTELSFIAGRQKSGGEFTPPGGIVLHLYGRFCNANKFAGEVDVLEALNHVTNHYAIDPNKIVVRGFSMGGASCWHLAVHHPDFWAAAAPGAGFTETPIFMKISPTNELPEWEKKLWHLYDSIDYAANLFNLPTVAYSGEIDKQKQAADAMAKAMSNEGMDLVHIIGPNTPHRYHPESKEIINRHIDDILAKGKVAVPQRIRFTTWTLKYNESFWVRVEGLEKHWERARVDAEIAGNAVRAETTNVSELVFSMPAGTSPFTAGTSVKVFVDKKEIASVKPGNDKSWNVRLKKSAGEWKVASDAPEETGLRKRHDLQGPIDDAFMGRFVFVLPSGTSMNEKVGEWTAREAKSAAEEWRAQFRGDVRVVKDTDLSEKDIDESHLILWGDPKSSRVIARIADRLPIKWDESSVRVGGKSFESSHHVPVFIYPNPLNPRRYIVINSGVTFVKAKSPSNADQIPKLPDYAVVDLDAPKANYAPIGVMEAGFFNENWKLP